MKASIVPARGLPPVPVRRESACTYRRAAAARRKDPSASQGNFSCVRGQSGDFDRISFLVNSVWCGGTIGTRQAAKTLVLAQLSRVFQ